MTEKQLAKEFFERHVLNLTRRDFESDFRECYGGDYKNLDFKKAANYVELFCNKALNFVGKYAKP